MTINFLVFLVLVSSFSGLLPDSLSLVDFNQKAVETLEVREVREVWVTAYSSTPDQTDSTPFTTASGNRVRSGIVACNFLQFGTKIQIPELFGEEIFVVDDRMHRRKTNFVDVWMPTREDAIKFGITRTHIVVLN
ncbi:3D domain-containing protein [Patescibacteria group bacterium]|nr:3D domain-containing protein [Patescibacteria group bacterium]